MDHSRLLWFYDDASRLRAVTEMLLGLDGQWLGGLLIRLATKLLLAYRVHERLRYLWLVLLQAGLLASEVV
jgi:hypothetical protein